MTDHTAVRVHPDVVFQKLGDEAVLLNLRTGVYWGLNPTGAVIWDEIKRHGKFTGIVSAVHQRFEASEAEIRSSVRSLVDELSREGLVVLDESQ